jgi:hypothetical protein|nr:MAG TPA: hypothetical protein [Caudoviricetes sp.]
MTFRLKDKNLQVQLDALSDGDFSKRLQHANHYDGMIFVEFGEKLESPGFDLHRFNLAFFDDEVKEIHRYNPHGWNAFPEVEPPEGVWMSLDESRALRRRENVPLRRSLRSRRGLRRLRMVE